MVINRTFQGLPDPFEMEGEHNNFRLSDLGQGWILSYLDLRLKVKEFIVCFQVRGLPVEPGSLGRQEEEPIKGPYEALMDLIMPLHGL